ncbi:MaoC/PaaZ C-terminal domain-containing protein [Acidisphaera sp. L21]|uniref:MaoC/PaaZ C-terminal domain-containing protein n=1 Tax=Acidisphaera sp. L21 TaxID=1641851 RepID=UPI00131B26E7|nr:MaoC/PaaZ C-terminal domain-containing protein [Acidisphaera sp. L21]
MGRYFEQFAVDATFRTPGRTITEADIGTFAGLTGDYNPVHTDAEFAATTEFGTRIAHGPFGIGLAFGLASRLDLIDGTVIALLSVQWEFKAPVRAGDTLHAEIAVTEARPSKKDDRGVVGLRFAMMNQKGETTQAGTCRLLMRRTPGPPAYAA